MIEAVSCVGVNAERRLEVSICDDPDSHIFFEKVAAPVNPALKFPDYITEIITEIGPRTLIYIPQVFTRHLRKQHDIHEQIYTHTIQNVPTLPVSGTACGRGHSTDFGLGWEQMNLVVGRWGSRIKVRHHLLDTSVGRRSPPDPHLLQSMLGRRLESLEVLALGLGPTEILDVGSHMAGAWDEVGFRECFAKAEASTCIPVHDHEMPICVQRRLVCREARVRELV
jgi:hypothetical protein